MLIACGSATTWMVKNLIDNHSGFHNRITHEIHLSPFNLLETKQMLRSQGCTLDKLSILQIYMALGGIPYYLSLVRKGESAVQAINRLFFSEKAAMRYEYERLFASLFRDPAPYLITLEDLFQ